MNHYLYNNKILPPFLFPPEGAMISAFSFPLGGRSGWGSIRFKKLLFILSFLTFSSLLSAQADRKLIREGNRDYLKGKYAESELAYRKASDRNNKSLDARFNTGDALYKQNKFEEAAKIFTENAGSTVDKKKKADSFYNLGNSLLNSKKLPESIEAYKNSLKLDPTNAHAKYNLAYAQDQLKQQQQLIALRKAMDEENKDNKNQKDQDKNKDQQKDQDKQQDQKDKKQQEQQQGISKDDAQRLLDALANDEKKVQEKVKKEKAAKGRVKTVINW